MNKHNSVTYQSEIVFTQRHIVHVRKLVISFLFQSPSSTTTSLIYIMQRQEGARKSTSPSCLIYSPYIVGCAATSRIYSDAIYTLTPKEELPSGKESKNPFTQFSMSQCQNFRHLLFLYYYIVCTAVDQKSYCQSKQISYLYFKLPRVTN